MFVVFEGIDGSGKTTVSNLVAERLRAAGLTVEHLREGGKFASRVTQSLREFGRDVRNLELVPEAEFFLYVTRDVQLLEEMTRPALGRADVVIADRFLFSAEVLARFGRGLPESYVRPVLQAAARGLEPDLVVLVDVDPHIARARRRVAKVVTAERRPPSRKGLGGVGMQHRFREGYRELAADDPARWVTVDNDRDLQATVDLVTEVLRTAHQSGVAAGVAVARHRGPHQRPGAERRRPPSRPALARFLDRVDRRMEREPQTAAYLLGGLYGPGHRRAPAQLLALAPETVLAGLNGLVRSGVLGAARGRSPPFARPGGPHPAEDRPGCTRARAAAGALVGAGPAGGAAGAGGRGRRWRGLAAARAPLRQPSGRGHRCAGRASSSRRAWQLRERWLQDLGGEAAVTSFERAPGAGAVAHRPG